MGGLVMLERFVWFDRELKSGCYPNASRLARKFKYILATDRSSREASPLKAHTDNEEFLHKGEFFKTWVAMCPGCCATTDPNLFHNPQPQPQ